MTTEIFVHRSRMPAAAEEVFQWHARPGALERLMPPWDPVDVIERQGSIKTGARLVLKTHIGPLPMTMVMEHRDYEAGVQFCDVQLKGPFARYRHVHRIEPAGPTASFLHDRIEYELPGGRLGQFFGARMVRKRLRRMFAYRHRITSQDLALHSPYRDRKLHFAVTGASGLVGSALTCFLTTGGHRVTRLVRDSRLRANASVAPESAAWDPQIGLADAALLDGVDAVVHLAGENIVDGRWNPAKKTRIRESRVQGTRALCESLARRSRPPRVLVAASAIGYYGDRGDFELDENSPPGQGFLPDVCRDGEAATESASKAGIRVINLRIGVVLTPAGGALRSMLTPFQLGIAGRLGSGRQYLSWISLEDLVGAIYHSVLSEQLVGPVNAVAPQVVTNREFTKTLGKVLSRPTLIPAPAFCLRLLLGEMADELLLASTHATPQRLLATAFSYRQPDLETALRQVLGRNDS